MTRVLVKVEELRELRADSARVTFLEALNARGVYGGLAVLRDSGHGRGWRLHETSPESARFYVNVYGVAPKGTVREAVDDAMRRANEYGMDPLRGDRKS